MDGKCRMCKYRRAMMQLSKRLVDEAFVKFDKYKFIPFEKDATKDKICKYCGNKIKVNK